LTSGADNDGMPEIDESASLIDRLINDSNGDNVSENSADVSINQFAQQVGVQVLYPYDLVRQYRTKKIVGKYSFEKALSQLLYITNLQAEITFSKYTKHKNNLNQGGCKYAS